MMTADYKAEFEAAEKEARRRRDNAEAWLTLNSYPGRTQVRRLYDQDCEFAQAVADLVNSYHGDSSAFEYPNHSHDTVARLLRRYALPTTL